jgi:hypothetical protein
MHMVVTDVAMSELTAALKSEAPIHSAPRPCCVCVMHIFWHRQTHYRPLLSQQTWWMHLFVCTPGSATCHCMREFPQRRLEFICEDTPAAISLIFLCCIDYSESYHSIWKAYCVASQHQYADCLLTNTQRLWPSPTYVSVSLWQSFSLRTSGHFLGYRGGVRQVQCPRIDIMMQCCLAESAIYSLCT